MSTKKKINESEAPKYPEGIVVLPTGQIMLTRFSKNGFRYEILKSITRGTNIFDCSVLIKKVDTGEVGEVKWPDLHLYNS